MKIIYFTFILLFLNCYSSQSVCVFNEGEFYNYTNILNCFHSILLTDDVKYTTLETLKRSLELYSFYDISHDSPDINLQSHINMQLGLSEIADRPYIYDMEFHEDLRYLFIQLNDAHTQYYLPECYQNILIRQGFAPIAIGDSNNSDFAIKISPYFPDDLVSYYMDSFNINLIDYTNYTIISINNVPSLEYFMTYANTSVGMAKDAGIRFNLALTLPEPRDDISIIQYGYWQQRTHRNPFPQTDSILYELLSPSGETSILVLPWTFKALKSYHGMSDWLNDYYDSQVINNINIHKNNNEKHKKPNNKTPDIYEKTYMNINNHKILDNIQLFKDSITKKNINNINSYTFELLVNSTDLTFWQLSDNKTLVMYLDTFGPGPLSGYYPSLINGFKIAAERGLSRLIIDLSNNGGGNICLGRALLAFFQQQGWMGQGQNWGAEDLPLSNLANILIDSAIDNNITTSIWSPAFYDNQNNEHINNTEKSYLSPGVPHFRGGYLRNYSKLVHIDSCGDYGYFMEPAVIFQPSDVIIMTNGLCGSTCALFANHMSLFDNIKTIVLGGMPNRDIMQYTSFPGGQVLEKEPLYDQLLLLHQNITYVPYSEIDYEDVVPRMIPTQADFRFCIREIYPPEKEYSANPMEFTFQQATYHLYHNEITAIYPQYAWYEALQYF